MVPKLLGLVALPLGRQELGLWSQKLSDPGQAELTIICNFVN